MNASILLISIFSFLAHAESSRPMSEMHGDCTNFKMDLKQEFALWEKQAESRPLTLGAKTRVDLGPQSKVKFTKAPEKDYEVKGRKYGGIALFRVPTTGVYRISLGKKAWYDVVDPAKKSFVEAKEFEMQSECDKIFKVVSFPLEADHAYELQLSGSPVNHLDVLLTRAP